jgi:hypothetical protein
MAFSRDVTLTTVVSIYMNVWRSVSEAHSSSGRRCSLVQSPSISACWVRRHASTRGVPTRWGLNEGVAAQCRQPCTLARADDSPERLACASEHSAANATQTLSRSANNLALPRRMTDASRDRDGTVRNIERLRARLQARRAVAE